MNRREFVVSAAGGVGAMATLARRGEALRGYGVGVQPSATKFKKAVKYGMIDGGSTVLEKFQILRSVGFDGVELDSPGGPKPDEVLKAKEETGIEVPGVVNSAHWTKPLSHRDPGIRVQSRQALETVLRDCKAYGGTSVLLVPAVVNKETPYDAAYERSQAEIRKALPLARELGVRIAIENVWNNFLLSPLEAARYTDELDPEWVGWHFDPGNIVTYGWPEQWIRTLGSRILKLDVKEFSRALRDREGLWKGFNIEIGDGDCDWPAIRAALAEVGYGAAGSRSAPAWATAEVAGGDENRLRAVHARMSQVLDA